MTDRELQLQDVGERDVIRRLAAILSHGEDVQQGIGDDTAVVSLGEEGDEFLLTTDPVIEGVHFQADADPVQVGHKALGRVLSDIAAMGGVPRFALVDVAAPPSCSMQKLESLYKGIQILADRYGVDIVGGDTSKAGEFQIHVFGVGVVPCGKACLRSRARSGEDLYVTGEMGGSAAGHHLTFEPRVREGIWLREQYGVEAMMDLTDGLAADLAKFCEASEVGAEIEAALLPIREGSSLSGALGDGEDFELLFTLPADKETSFSNDWKNCFDQPVTRIGRIKTTGGIGIRTPAGGTEPLSEAGFEHFK